MDLDLIRLSRYPFLKVSRDHVKGLGISLGAMLTGENVTVREAAVRRIEEAVEGSPIDLKRKRARDEVERDLLSYPIARFLVAAVADPHLIKWFSHHEGERARAFLEGEDTDIVRYVGEELGLPLMPPPEGDDSGERIPRISKVDMMRGREAGRKDLWWVSLTDFLPSRRNITGPQWDLSNRRVKKGMVALERSSYIRLLQERVRTRVEEGLWSRPSVPAHPGVKELINGLRMKVESRKRRYSPTDLGRMSITRLPPCMKQILGMAQAGENLPHHARFALVAFLNGIGMSPDDIFRIFTTAPDFKEDIVRYQIDHITGTTSATSYSMPNCETMKSGGICFNPDSLCEKEWLNNPLYYYRIKGKKKHT